MITIDKFPYPIIIVFTLIYMVPEGSKLVKSIYEVASS